MENKLVKTIIIPQKPTVDIIASIFILKKFGKEEFINIEDASIDVWATIPDGENFESLLLNEGLLLLDISDSPFYCGNSNHTLSEIVAEYLDVKDDPTLAQLLEYSRRDAGFSKGTMPDDPVNIIFSLSGIINALNKSFPNSPDKVTEIILPLIVAYHDEQQRRYHKFPEEVAKKIKNGQAVIFDTMQRDEKVRAIMIKSDNIGIPEYLKSRLGGKFDIVVSQSCKGYTSILTRQSRHLDLRSLVALLRIRETEKNNTLFIRDLARIMSDEEIDEIQEWHYIKDSNSIVNATTVENLYIPPTQIPWQEIQKLVDLGISEKLLNPKEISH